MKGLLKNNFMAVYVNARMFFLFMLILGIYVILFSDQAFLVVYAMIGMIGFSVIAIAVTRNEYASKWWKFKLTLPVRRSDIVKSLFFNQLIWLLVGTLFAGVGLGLAWLLHGCPFDYYIDILSMFALGISMSLFAGAIFFPLFYVGGEERSEVILVIALLCAFCLDWAIITIYNEIQVFGTASSLVGVTVLTMCSLLAFVLSCPLSAAIFKRREY